MATPSSAALKNSALAALQAKYGTQIGDTTQLQRWQYYDAVRLNDAGVNQLSFFTNALGGVDPVSGLNKTLEEVNTRRAGELDEAFVIMAVKTEIQILPISRQPAGVIAVTDAIVQSLTPVHAALRNMYMQGVLSVSFGQKQFMQIEQPFQKCPPGYGPSIKTISANGAAGFPPISNYCRASTAPDDVYQMTPPIVVEKGQTFTAAINFYLANTPVIPQVGGANVAVNVSLIFDGFVLRPTQ